MKNTTKLLTLPLCCLALTLAAGCNNKTYTVYTNVPEGFEIIDKSYHSGELIGGYAYVSSDIEEVDASGYTAKQWSYYAMTADAQLVVYADFEADGALTAFNEFQKAVGKKLYDIEKAVSSTVTNSDIYNFNNAQAGERLEISQTAYEVLSQAKYVYDLTEGYYNPALYYNVLAYGFGGAESRPEKKKDLPNDEVIEKYTSLASHFGEVELGTVQNAESGAVKYYVTKPDCTVEVDGEVITMKLDLGGIGKGYAVDCVDRLFDEYGYKFGLFNFGTSSMLVKSNPKGGSFSLGLSSPRSPSRDAYLSTSVRNEKLSTSGDNEQCYFIGKTRYCHIISPKTGKPVQTGITTASVIGGSAAEDDALTTAIMAMETDVAIKFIEEKLTDRKVFFACE